MQLRYCGINYELNPFRVEMVATGLNASFRGLSYPVQRCINLESSRNVANLKYRGIFYSCLKWEEHSRPTSASTPALVHGSS
ncbi:MAG: DUF4278 domain-containing protein [Cyanobacteria bacterium]|nr:DUF4278 domain-containing protein [Cyanobacteria bacterium GSL.Bin1]